MSDLLGAFEQVMGQNLDLLFVGDLFTYLTGTPLTLLDLTAMVLAIPATLIYKATLGAAPFATDAAFQQFQQVITAQNLLSASGLGSSSMPAVPGDGMAMFQIFYEVCYSTVYFFYTLSDPVVDMWPLETSPPLELSWLVMGLEWSEMVFSIPCAEGVTGGPSCMNVNGVTIWNWIFDVVACIGDQLFMVLPNFKRLATNAGDLGVFFDFVVGCIDLTLGLATAIVAKDAAGGVEEVSSALTDIGKLGRLTDMVASTDGVSLLVTPAIDFLGDCVVWGVSPFTIDAGTESPRWA